jgi:hypothetical protein
VPLDIHDQNAENPSGDQRPYIGMLFECCGVYARIYRQPERMVYQGRCPKCLRLVRVRVAKDGVDARFFRAH